MLRDQVEAKSYWMDSNKVVETDELFFTCADNKGYDVCECSATSKWPCSLVRSFSVFIYVPSPPHLGHVSLKYSLSKA